MPKASPVKQMIEKKKQYVPMPSIDKSARKNNNPTFAISAPITQVTTQVWLPCGPIPLCNSITAGQIVNFANEVNNVVGAAVDVVSNNAGNLITEGTDNWAYLNATTINGIVNSNTNLTTLQGDINDLDTRVTTAEGNITNLDTRVTTAEGNITNLQNADIALDTRLDALELIDHVPATITGNGIVTSTASGTDNQSFQLGLNIGQLPSTDSNNAVTLWVDWKLYVSQATISTSGFNVVATIALRDAQTVDDGHITQVTADPTPANNGFYIYDTAGSIWTALVPNATVISVNGHTGTVVLIPSDLAYVATISGTPVTNVQEALDAIRTFLNNFNTNVASSITNSTAVQTALENFIENTDFTLLGDITFSNNTVTFNNSDVNFTNGTTLNYDTTTVSNHTGDTTNYTGGSINTTTTTQTNTGWTITNNNVSITNTGTTNTTGGTYTNVTINNPTLTGAWVVGADEKLQATRTVINQVIPLTTIPRSGIKSLQISVIGGIIQISPTDYSYNAGTNEITMLIDPPINPTEIEIQYAIKDALVALPADTLQTTQTAHGFVVLDWIRFDETTSTWVKAQANAVSGIWSRHVVSVVDVNTFLISKDGTHTIPNSLTPWEYVLSDTTAWAYTQTLSVNPASYTLYGMEVIDTNTINFYTVVWVSNSANSGGSWYTTRTVRSWWTVYQSISWWLVTHSCIFSNWSKSQISFIVLPWEYYTSSYVSYNWIFWYVWPTSIPSTLVATATSSPTELSSELYFIYE